MKKFLMMSVLVSVSLESALGAIHARGIPRSPTQHWESDGFFEGGKPIRANLEAMRFSDHPSYERWVVDFSNASRRVGVDAPRFQLRYIPKQSLTTSAGENVISKPAKLVLLFRSIDNNFLDKQRISKLVEKSKRVADVVVYPPIDDGSTAIELVLKDDMAFAPYQPVEREGRLVIDIRRASAAISSPTSQQ